VSPCCPYLPLHLRPLNPSGVQLLPESYAALILSHMGASPPNAAVAEAVYAATAGTDTNPQIPWAVLCR
jgi:hypothetical protein